jgi:hypothetical protein
MPQVIERGVAFADRLQEALREGLAQRGIRAEVTAERVPTTRLHRAVVAARQFRHMPFSERQEVVWTILRDRFTPEERLQVSIVHTLTPAEMGE